MMEIDESDPDWGACEIWTDEIDAELVSSHVCGKGNAALMAAAPDMHEALSKIAAHTYGTELCNTDAENYEIVSGHLRRFQEIARAALAKARGEEP